MITRMPRWIWLGGFVLSFLAGIINVISLLIFQHQAVSHVTGSIAQLGINMLSNDIGSAWHIVGVLVSFLIGSTASGFIIRNAVLSFGKRYGVVLMIESFLIFIAIWGFLSQFSFADFFISAACGMQNAMATTYSGAVIRTTHMTGVITDLGILIGHYLRGMRISFLRLRMFVALLTGFVLGSIVGAYVYVLLSFYALLIPGVTLFLIGFSYTLFRLKVEREDRKMEKLVHEHGKSH